MRHVIISCVALLVMAFTAPVWGQPASNRPHDAAMQRGNAAYNSGDYKQAIRAFVDAIQASPSRPDAYRNLARSYFWTGDYPAAVEYYDHFLRLATGEHDKIKAERRLAADRAGSGLYSPPEAQRLALQALENELESGRAYTSGGGGAWGRYETLLRTGYAEPDLVKLRSTLARRLVDEFDANLIPRPGQITPRLDLDDWQLQAERLAAATRIADDPGMLDVAKKRSTIAEAAIAMLTSQWDNAADLAQLARQSNPDQGFVVWFELTSLIGAGRYDEALLTLVDHEKTIPESDVARRDYIRVLRAVTLQRLDRDADAATLYLEVLRR